MSGPEASGQTLRRHELAAFLRSRRERITPEDVGLPGGFRRRTAGLRREEVAQLAGVGVTWYTWLEQGRPIRTSASTCSGWPRCPTRRCPTPAASCPGQRSRPSSTG